MRYVFWIFVAFLGYTWLSVNKEHMFYFQCFLGYIAFSVIFRVWTNVRDEIDAAETRKARRIMNRRIIQSSNR